MARFTTRVELHKATETDYETLHEEMANEGFSRTITSGENIEYYLPTAEYNLIGEYTPDSVREFAERAAKKTGKMHSILVTPATSDERRWSGLVKVKS